ncbi:C2 family cysteine protease [Brachybacterium sp. AOP43-C2-M15]|uniref:C2 family cysteine protease n=1 Tax=Brachybacterium sp. AOP43-C2-M15 TaxID=3457661 RepID=UPI0040344FE7
MDFWGARTDDLVDLARAVRDRGHELSATGQALQTTVASVTWEGSDADRFRATFEQCRQELSLTSDHLGSTAEHLTLQAAEQDAASDPAGRIDAADYDGMLGGEFLDWSDVINAGERVSDLWRDRVEAGDADSPLGELYTDVHPDWDGTDVDIDQQGIEGTVVRQGSLGDCWYLAALMAVQQTDPGLLADNISGLGRPPGADGWEVRLFIDGQWQDVAVGPDDLGTNGTRDHRSGEPTWATIYEMAMINAHDGRASAVSADTPAAGLEMITGESARESDTLGQPSFEDYRQAIDEGRPVTVMTDPLKPIGPAHDDLVAAHVYQVSGYDESTGEIILTNPHGPSSANPYEVRIDPDHPAYATSIFMTGIGG